MQRHAARGRGRVRRGHRDGERRVGAEARLGRRAVELDQARVERGLVVGAQAGDGARDLAVDVGDGAASRRGRRRRAPPSRSSSASRDPFDAPAGTIARPTAPPASATSASTVGRPRLSQTRRARTARMRQSASLRVAVRLPPSSLEDVLSPRSPVVLMVSSVPLARRRRRRRGARRAGAAARRRRAARARDRRRRRCTRPATCRRRARAAARAAAPRRGARSPSRGSQSTASRYAAASASNAARNAAVAAGVHRHFSSRWLRQNARSNAGSPHHAHSASRNTGPSAPITMFFGLTSPWTSARFVAAVVATSCSSAGARSGWRRAVASR